MGTSGDFGDKKKKSFDFASDVVKQQITLASAILALLLAAARIVADDLDSFDVVILIAGSSVFFLSIVMGCWTLMGLTFQLTTANPSLFDGGLRGKAILQAVLFVLGVLATVIFGISAAVAQESEEDVVLMTQADIAALLPTELASREHAQAFTKALAQWNTGDLQLPTKNAIRRTFEARLKAAVADPDMGYETTEWRDRRLAQFEELPQSAKPEKELNRPALRSVLWAFSINLPLVEERYKSGTLIKENPLPYFLLLTAAQEEAIRAGTKTITASQVASAAFKWWTNDWPFCSPEEA